MRNKNNFTRRDFFRRAGLGAAGLSLAGSLNVRPGSGEILQEMLVYIGTYTSGKSEGIYVCKLNLSSGHLKHHKTVKGVVEPSFLAIDPARRYLYAVNETAEYEGRKSGAVSAFAIDRKTGDLRFLNRQPSMGGAPCYVTVDDQSRFVLVANYLGGNVSVFPLEKDGRLGAPSDLEQHSGTGPDKERQEAAHAHSIVLSRDNRFAFAGDLGADKVYIYRFDAKTGKLEPNQAQPFYQTRPGAGPRHFTFHPENRFAFVINELDTTISSLAYDAARGALKEIQTVPTLPAGWKGENTCADIHVSPNGRFLYGSNRGHDSLVSYRIDEKTGRLEYVEHTPTGGKTPRNFAIDPTGRFLLAANQNSDSIVVFRIDEKTGRLQPTGKATTVPSPVCLKLISDFSA